MVWRWLLVGYFISWLVISGIAATGEPKWLIYLTNWAFTVFVVYLIVAAFSVTVKFFTVHCGNSDLSTDRATDYQFNKPTGCCGNNQLSWYQMVHWFCFTIGGEVAPMILVLYWAVLYSPGSPLDGVSLNTHLINGIVSIADLIFTGVPISLLHIIYPVAFSATYTAFTGVYFAANGTNPSDEPFIYPVLNYGAAPLTASLYSVLIALVFVPFMHLVYYCIFLIRFWLVYALYGHSKVACYRNAKGANHKEMDSI